MLNTENLAVTVCDGLLCSALHPPSVMAGIFVWMFKEKDKPHFQTNNIIDICLYEHSQATYEYYI